MVMAGNENVSGPLVEDSLATRLQWLRQRRETLQEKLTQKNNELKSLCVEEAELTGILPPEIPLEPGENPPSFRRRVGTAFTYPQNLINKLKTNEAEESALELERQVQIGIVEAALGIVNDPMESKAVRRKHRLVYQQSQRRLQELDARLTSIRQSRGKTHRSTQYQHVAPCGSQSHLHTNVKHRTKKPRPPLDSIGSEGCAMFTRGVIQESGGVSLNLLGIEQKSNTYPGYEEQLTVSNISNHNYTNAYSPTSPIDQRQNVKIMEHDHNDNHNIYILPDQYRIRTYSHGSGGSRSHSHYLDTERTYRPVPNTYSDEERQIRYRQFQPQQHKQHQLQEEAYHQQQYAEYNQVDNEVPRKPNQTYYERDFHSSHHVYTPDYQPYTKNHSQSQLLQKNDRDSSGSRNLRHVGPPGDSHLPPGYWMRYDDEIIWCPEEQVAPDRFGSLDRRKRNAFQYAGSTNSETQSRYYTVAVGGSKNSLGAVSYQRSPIHLLPLTEQAKANNKMLLRTQSLGSVETWHSNHSHESQDGKDTIDNVSRKGKEKEWYETSVDSGTSPGLDFGSLIAHKNIHSQSSSPPISMKNVNTVTDAKDHYSSSQSHRKKKVLPEHQQQKVLEIPAESKQHQEVGDEAIPVRSPHNCTVVQAGKYQPYREITKPFEMSDFYKYSTKFRKRNETLGQTSAKEAQPDSHNVESAKTGDSFRESTSSNLVQNGAVTSPIQKKVYQPVQRMTCQPYLSR